MPALRCPQCGASDLHAVDVETVELDVRHPGEFQREHYNELACKRCGWTPTKSQQPNQVVAVSPIDANVE